MRQLKLLDAPLCSGGAGSTFGISGIDQLWQWSEKCREQPPYSRICAVRAQCCEFHPALEFNRFAHSRHRVAGRVAGGTMKRFTSQGIAA